jgi:hypothetical protein
LRAFLRLRRASCRVLFKVVMRFGEMFFARFVLTSSPCPQWMVVSGWSR